MVDLRKAKHYGYVYLLFQKIATKIYDVGENEIDFSLYDRNEWNNAGKFRAKIGQFKGYKTYHNVGYSWFKEVLALLKGKEDTAYEPTRNESILDIICQDVFFEKNLNSWQAFKQSIKEEDLQYIIKEKRETIKWLNMSAVIVCYVTVETQDYTKTEQDTFRHQVETNLQKRFEDEFRSRKARMKFIFAEEAIPVSFDEPRPVSHEYSVLQAGGNNKADIVVWGKFMLEKDGQIHGQLKYRILNNTFQKRIKEAYRNSGWESLKAHMIEDGSFFSDLDQAIHLILAINYLTAAKPEHDGYAIDHLERIPDDSKCAEAWYIQGCVNFIKGESAEAEKYWKKSIDLDKNHVRARINLARRYLDLKKFNKQEQMDVDINALLDIPDLKREAADIRLRIGEIYMHFNHRDKAKEILEAVVAEECADKEYAYLWLGDLKKDISCYQTAAKISTDFFFHKLCMGRMKEIAADPQILEDAFNDITRSLKKKQGKIKALYSQPEPDSPRVNQFELFDIKGGIKSTGPQEKELKEGDIINLDDILCGLSAPSSALVILYPEIGFKQEIGILKLPKPHKPQYAFTCYQSCLKALKDADAEDSELFLESITYSWADFPGASTVRVEEENGSRFRIIKKNNKFFVLLKNEFTEWIKPDNQNKIRVEIGLEQEGKEFQPYLRKTLVFIDEEKLKSKIKLLSPHLSGETQQESYKIISTYLSEMYANIRPIDVGPWLIRVGVSI